MLLCSELVCIECGATDSRGAGVDGLTAQAEMRGNIDKNAIKTTKFLTVFLPFHESPEQMNNKTHYDICQTLVSGYFNYTTTKLKLQV